MSFLYQDEGCLKPPKSPVGIIGTEFRCEIVTDFERLEELSTAWERLWESDPKSEIFQSFTWARAWWQAFGENFTLCVPVIYERDEVALILPLVQRGATLRFLGSPQADYCDLLCSHVPPAKLLSVALEAVLRSAPAWKECILQGLRPDSHMIKAWRELPHELRCLLQLEITDGCPTILLGENRDQVIDSLLASKHLRRRLHKLEKAGVVTFRHIDSRTEAHQQLARFFRHHQRRCAVLAKASSFEEPGMRGMMRTLVEQLNLQQELRFGVLEVDGRALAWSLGFQVHGKYAYYQQTFDIDAEDYAPGEVLLYHLLLYARKTVEREFDFLRGDEFFKKRFAAHINQLRTLYFERPGLRGRLRQLGRAAQGQFYDLKIRIEGFARTHERVFQVLRSIQIWKRGVSRRLRRARQTGELADYLLGSCFELFRRAVWSKHVATLFQMENGTAPTVLPQCLTSDPGIDIVAGRFSDLADLALEHPEISFPGFREYRERVKRGDRVYLVQQNAELALVAWTGTRAVGDAPRLTQVSTAAASKRAVVMYECWPIHNPSVGCTQLLSLLTSEASKAKTDVLICCPAVPLASQVELQRQGFFPKSRIVGHRILRWLRHSSIRDHSAADQPQSAEDGVCPKLRKRSKL